VCEKFPALNEALREELQRLKITAGQMSAANGSRGAHPHFPPQPQSFVQCGNHHTQQQQPHMPQSTTSTQNIGGQTQPSFMNFNNRG